MLWIHKTLLNYSAVWSYAFSMYRYGRFQTAQALLIFSWGKSQSSLSEATGRPTGVGSNGSAHQSLMDKFVFPFPRAKVRSMKFILGQNTTERSKPFVRGRSFYLDSLPRTAAPWRPCLRWMKRYGLRQTTWGAPIANKKIFIAS